MLLLAVGCNFRSTPLDLRERLAFPEAEIPRALNELSGRYGCEALIISTCNRVELYLARLDAPAFLDAELVTEFLGEFHRLPAESLRPHFYDYRDAEAVRHLFRVVASLDSLIVGEGQIAGQVKRAYELAQQHASAGPVLHALLQHARLVAKRVRTETGISRGNVSVSSAAVEYLRQVFAHFGDKTVLVVGTGKMGERALKHLQELKPRRILVTNRSAEKAAAVAKDCGGLAVPWEMLDDALVQADIILSSTGAKDLIVTRPRWEKVLARKSGGPVVILDIAVPRDFDPDIHDGEQTCLINTDDLHQIRDRVLQDRLKHVGPAEAIVEHEQRRFLKEWARRRNGPVIALLTQDFEKKRQAVEQQMLKGLNGLINGYVPDEVRAKVTALVEGGMRLYQNQCLHGPISALTEENHEAGGHTLLEALRKLFRLRE